MANAMNSSSAYLSSSRQLNKCFQPIFHWMKILGICLTGDHLFSRLYGMLMFSFTLASNVASMALMLLDEEEKPKEVSSINSYTFKQIIVIDNLNFTTSVVGVHLMLLCQTRLRWKKLWNTLLEIEIQLNSKILKRSVYISLLFIPVRK